MSSLYEPLAESDIRLLTVTVHSEVATSLELQTYSRTEAPEYDAVSYTWGDELGTTSLMCNGVALDIRTNLFKALPCIHTYRPEPRTRPLWIDAICLDQGNRDEKAIHVPLMGDIYVGATRTLVWLGDADESGSSDLAIDNIESLTQKLLAVEDPASLTVRHRLTKYNMPLPEDQKWEAIKVFQLRPWFFRLWTLQEIVLSKEAILLCGRKTISWNSLSALHQAAFQAQLGAIAYTITDSRTDSRIIISHVDFLRRLRRERKFISLPMLLHLSVDRGYQLSVDRVWALLGLLNTKYRQLVRDARLVDYEKEAISNYHKTFLEIAKFHVKHDTLIAMQIIENNLRTVRNPSLPSWCPDWHTEQGGISLARWPEALAGMPGGQSRRFGSFMQINEDSSLELCGIIVDVIKGVTKSPGKKMLDLESYSWLVECWEVIKKTSFNPYDLYPSKPIIPAAPSTWADGSPTSERWQRYKAAEELVKYLLYPPGTLFETSARTLLWCNGRKFFCTEGSRLGIGPADLQENDLLCAIFTDMRFQSTI